MSLGRRFVSTGAADAVCLTESVQVFGADSTYSSNIALYQLDGNDDDTTTNYNGISDANVTYSSTGAYIGQAAIFNGSNAYIDLGTSIASSTRGVSMWVYADDFTERWAFQQGDGQGVENYIRFYNTDDIQVRWGNVTQTFSGYSANTWYHIFAQKDENDNANVWINGVEMGSTGTPSAIAVNKTHLGVRYNGGSLQYYFKGKIDQVRIFNKALNAQDIATLYAETSSTASNTNPLNEGAGLALWSLDTDASEESGYYTGTPSSSVDFGVGGKINTGVRYSASTGSTITTPLSSSDLASNFSVSFWIKLDNPNSFQVFNGLYSKSPISNQGWVFYTQSISSSYYFGWLWYYDTSQNYNTVYNNSIPIVADTWYHVALSFTNGSLPTLYVNKTASNSNLNTTTTAPVYNAGSVFQIGSTPNTNLGAGVTDQVRIFNKAISSSEVDSLYAETACVHTATANTADFPTGATTVAHFPLDNNTFDNKSTNDATSETDIEYRFGKYGQAAVFNGSTSEIITGYAPPATTTATISLWVNFKAYTNPYAILAADNNTGTTRNSFFTLATGGSGYGGSGYLWVSIGNGSSHDEDTTISFDDHGGLGNWIHVAATVSGTSVKIYMNGYETKSYTSAVSYAPSGSGYAYRLGNTTGWNALDGRLDQVRFYSTELSSSQILELYNEKPEIDTSNFKAILYKGSSSKQYISNVGFNLDVNNSGDGGFVWIKQRTSPTRHPRNYDTVRGVYPLYSSLDNLEGTSNPIDYDANGFFFDGGESGVNENAEDYVGWVFRAGGQAQNIGVNTITGSTPSIASDVSANTTAGFSIVKATFNTSSPQTVAHGLSSAPELIFSKRVSGSSVSSGDWNLYHKFIDSSYPENYFIKLNARDGRSDNAIYWNDTAPTSDVFTTGSIYDQNETVIFYCWHSVNSYSKIGTYEGNGTSDNKIYTTDDGTSTGSYGFKPSFVMLKNVDRSNTGWLIHDTARDPVNTSFRTLRAESDQTEYTSTSYWLMDFESDGFRLKYGADNEFNKNGETFIFMAFK